MLLKRSAKVPHSPRRPRASVTDVDHWLVHSADLCRVLIATPSVFQNASLIGLADGSPPPELRVFLAANAALVDPALLETLQWEYSSAVFLPVQTTVLHDLSCMAEFLAEPEVAIHLVVVRETQPLLEWHDLPGDPIAIAGFIPKELVARFAEMTGGRYERSAPGV